MTVRANGAHAGDADAPRFAASVIEARLGGGAQDSLEAAVALEAWGGLRARHALMLGARLIPGGEARRASSAPSSGEPAVRDGILTEAIALTMAILAVASWAGPLSRGLGSGTLARAIVVALPVTIALQWALRSRYLSRTSAFGCLARDSLALCAVALLGVEAPLVLLVSYGPLAGMFVAIWVGGTVLARRGWALPYGLLLVGSVIALESGAPAYPVLEALTAVIVAGDVIAIALGARTGEPAGPVGRALWAASTGGALGGLLVGDPSLGWGIHGLFPALALLPSVLGSVLGGYRLWRLYEVIPRGLQGVRLERADVRDARGPAMQIFLGSVLRLLTATVVLSGIVILASSWTAGSDTPSLFLAFACVALLTIVVNLLDSLGHTRVTLLCAIASLGTELVLVRLLPSHAPVPGTALIAGAGVGILVALPALLALLLRPGRVLATRLWIQ
jgi:hypothetical protein